LLSTCCTSSRGRRAAQAVYTALKETEQRATDVLPLWKLPALNVFSARQRKAAAAVALIRDTTERLIAQCREMVDDEEQARRRQSWLVRRAAGHASYRFGLAAVADRRGCCG
jgi:HEAT repeat protein